MPMVVDARKRLAPLKRFDPLKVLLLVRRVVLETMSEPPTLKVAPLIVPRDPVM